MKKLCCLISKVWGAEQSQLMILDVDFAKAAQKEKD